MRRPTANSPRPSNKSTAGSGTSCVPDVGAVVTGALCPVEAVSSKALAKTVGNAGDRMECTCAGRSKGLLLPFLVSIGVPFQPSAVTGRNSLMTWCFAVTLQFEAPNKSPLAETNLR